MLIYQAVRAGLSRVINTKINKSLATVEKFPPPNIPAENQEETSRTCAAFTTLKRSAVRIQTKKQGDGQKINREQREEVATCGGWSGLLITRL